jgi:hypothetical protein
VNLETRNECGKEPRELTVILKDGGGHFLGRGKIEIEPEYRECDPRKPRSVAEIHVQVNKDCGCIVTIGTYVREPR